MLQFILTEIPIKHYKNLIKIDIKDINEPEQAEVHASAIIPIKSLSKVTELLLDGRDLPQALTAAHLKFIGAGHDSYPVWNFQNV